MAVASDSLADGYVLRLEVIVTSQSVSGNYSNVTYSLKIIKGDGSGKFADGPHTWATNIGGNTRSGSIDSYDFRSYSSLTLASGSYRIYHDADGDKSLANSGGFNDNNTWGNLGDAQAVGTMNLEDIPRASQPTVSPTSVDAGATVEIITNRASADFTHTITYKMGSLTGTIATKTTDASPTWTVPMSILAAIPSTTSGTCTITVTTYSGTTSLGTKTVNLTVKAGAAVVPSFSTLTVAEGNSVVTTKIGAAFVKNVSSLALAINGAAPGSGSTIASYSISIPNVGTVNAQSGSLLASQSGTLTATATVKDSRGRSATKTLAITVMAYEKPKVSGQTFKRAFSTGVVDENGERVSVYAVTSMSSLIVGGVEKNKLTWVIETRLRGSTAAWTANGTWDVTAAPTTTKLGSATLAAGSSFDVRLSVTDNLTTEPITAIGVISTAGVFMDWSTGLGIGKYWERGSVDAQGYLYQNNGEQVISHRRVDGVDFNALTVSMRFSGTQMPNSPTGNLSDWFLGDVIHGPDGNWVKQIAHVLFRDDSHYIRRRDNGVWKAWQPVTTDLIGEVKIWPFATAPPFHLLCNGATYNTSQYPLLGALYGGAATFTVPDYRERGPVGHMAGSAEFGTLGAAVGAKSSSHEHNLGDDGWAQIVGGTNVQGSGNLNAIASRHISVPGAAYNWQATYRTNDASVIASTITSIYGVPLDGTTNAASTVTIPPGRVTNFVIRAA